MQFHKYFFWLFSILSNPLFAQVNDNTAIYQHTGSAAYFRLHYDNDFFTNSDQYYTQGIGLEFAHPSISRFLLSKILLRPNGSSMIYGVALNDLGYTPTTISMNEIAYRDRPFAATIFLKTFATATDAVKNKRLSSAITTGIIGPAAGGKQMQTGIHRWLKNTIPKGWQHQIQNDVVLNYEIKYEQRLWGYQNLVLLNAHAEIQAGTTNNKMGVGSSIMLGKFSNPYATAALPKQYIKKFNCYLYVAPTLSLVGYDASLQGGIFNHRSPYTIAAAAISRFTFQANAGLVMQMGKLNVAYTQSYLTKEFITGNYHRWAGLKITKIF